MSALGTLSREITQKLSSMALPAESAGKRATTMVPLINPHQTISDLQQILFDHVNDFKSINYIYVISDKGRLHGVLSIKDVFKNKPEKVISEIMNTKPIKVLPHMDQEKVAHIALSEGLKGVPVVNEQGYFLGVVDSDQIEDILDHESKEDLLKVSGIISSHDEEINGSVFVSFRNRIPWILIGLVGGLVTASTIGNFERVLENNLVLASFIPLIAYIANAVANQTQMLFIRELTIDAQFKFRNYLLRQLAITSMIAVSCWVLIYFLTNLFWKSPELGFIVGLAMSCAILSATFLSLFIPQLMKRIGLDPAVASGPFATVIQDFLSVTIYFSIASALL